MHLISPRARTAVLVSGAIVSIALSSACGQPAPAPSAAAARSAPAVAVSAEVARRGDIQQLLAYGGEIRATDSVGVAPKGTGRVERLAVTVGSQVKAGDAIARLDRGTAQIQLSQLQAALVGAQARLDTIRTGARTEDITSAQASLAQQQLKLQNMRSGGRIEDIQIAEGSRHG